MNPIILDIETVAIDDADTYIEAVSAPSNYKSEEAIAKYVTEKRAELIEKAALDVDLLRIIALGVQLPGHTPRVLLARDMSESEMLSWLWEQWDAQPFQRRLVTFNGLQYDIPALLRRSLYLGVHAPYIQCDRFKHPEVIDLMAMLSMDGKLKFHSLNFYLQRLAYPNGGPDITGAEIAARYAAGDWAAIEQHCRMDVEATKWLAERIGAIPKAQPITETAGAF